jgi:hypothetical protein
MINSTFNFNTDISSLFIKQDPSANQKGQKKKTSKTKIEDCLLGAKDLLLVLLMMFSISLIQAQTIAIPDENCEQILIASVQDSNNEKKQLF